MTDDLTRNLHQIGERIPTLTRSPQEIRDRAQRRRHSRRSMAGAALCGVAISVLVASNLVRPRVETAQPAQTVAAPSAVVAPSVVAAPHGYELMFARDRNVVVVFESSVPGDASPRRLERMLQTAIPAKPVRCEQCPSDGDATRTNGDSGEPPPSPDPPMYDITPESTMSDTDLEFNQQEAVISLAPWTRQLDLASEQLVLTGCIPDIGGLRAAEHYLATFRADLLSDTSEAAPPAAEGGYAIMRESVLRFDSIGAAIVAYAKIEAGVVDCAHGRGYTRDKGSSGYLEEWIDEAFIMNI